MFQDMPFSLHGVAKARFFAPLPLHVNRQVGCVTHTRPMPAESSSLHARVRDVSGGQCNRHADHLSRVSRGPHLELAFPDPSRRQSQYAVFWEFLIVGAMRYPWVLMTDAGESAAVWIPPGGTELAEEVEAEVEPLLGDLVGPRAGEVMELLARFDAAHPRDEPHFYLSLLGTDPAHAGHGLGMALLAETLERIDQEGMPAYLESSNPANNHRYERHGFAKVGEFFPPGSDIPVTTMWRDARSPSP
jgi:GNAT superfamily N-acetyltransferase